MLTAAQQNFVEGLLHAGRRAQLAAPPGTGKTVTSVLAARRLLDSGCVDSVLVATDSRAGCEFWKQRAREYGIELQDPSEAGSVKVDGVCTTTHALRDPACCLTLWQRTKEGRWFVIVDDPSEDLRHVHVQVCDLLSRCADNRALFISRTPRADVRFDSHFEFQSERYFAEEIAQRPEIQRRIIRYAPSLLLLDRLIESPQYVDCLTWKEFEGLIGALLQRDGYSVQQMRGTKDGGVDVFAVKDLGPAGLFSTVWQAKKRLRGKIGIQVIRELADTRQEHGASKAIIVTSGFLTRGALARVERDRYWLGKVDRDDLDTWIRGAKPTNRVS